MTFANKTGRNTQAISTISESGCGRQQVCHLHLPLLLNPHTGLLVYAVNIGQTQFLGSHFHHLEVNQISDMTSHFIIIFVLFLFSIPLGKGSFNSPVARVKTWSEKMFSLQKKDLNLRKTHLSPERGGQKVWTFPDFFRGEMNYPFP